MLMKCLTMFVTILLLAAAPAGAGGKKSVATPDRAAWCEPYAEVAASVVQARRTGATLEALQQHYVLAAVDVTHPQANDLMADRFWMMTLLEDLYKAPASFGAEDARQLTLTMCQRQPVWSGLINPPPERQCLPQEGGKVWCPSEAWFRPVDKNSPTSPSTHTSTYTYRDAHGIRHTVHTTCTFGRAHTSCDTW